MHVADESGSFLASSWPLGCKIAVGSCARPGIKSEPALVPKLESPRIFSAEHGFPYKRPSCNIQYQNPC